MFTASTTDSVNSTMMNNDDIIISATLSVVAAVLIVTFGILLIPIIVINNRRRMHYRVKHETNSEQPNGTGDLAEGGETTIDTINTCPSQTSDGEIETPGNHLYDDLINYTSQASHADTHDGQTTKVSGANTEDGTSIMKETDPTKDKNNSENHMYAVLEEAVPPVPERTYRLNTQAKKWLGEKEHNCANQHPSQNFDPEKATNGLTAHCSKDRETKEIPHTLTTIAAPNDDDDDEDVCDGKREVDHRECLNNHTYAVLEGPIQVVSPFQRQKTQSVGVRKTRSPNIAKRLSDTPHVYDTLIEKARHTAVSASVDDNPSANQYAVLEGPTPIEPSDHGWGRQVRKESFKLSMDTRVSETEPNGYDKLAPKDMKNVNTNQAKEECLSAKFSTTTTLSAGYDRLDLTSDSQIDMGHTYATLSPEEQSIKSKQGKKKLKKKQKQKQISNQDDDSHIYDILDPQSEINSCIVTDEHEILPPPAASTAISSCGRHGINAPHKRKISHSFSSRTLCDVTDGRKRSLTIYTAASDTNLHKIDPDSEAHIYDTVEVSHFPVSKRKQRCSGKRYRWLHLKERLQRQSSLEILGYPLDSTLMTPASHHVTKTDTDTKAKSILSASLGNVSEAVVDSNLEPNNTYASLDVTQTYAQVGPYVPGKRGSEQHKPDNEKDSEYSHLQHH